MLLCRDPPGPLFLAAELAPAPFSARVLRKFQGHCSKIPSKTRVSTTKRREKRAKVNNTAHSARANKTEQEQKERGSENKRHEYDNGNSITTMRDDKKSGRNR